MPHEGFLQAIRENPEDDTHRLIYADWLEENGEPARAEFIRIQCRLASLEEGDLGQGTLAAREKQLLEEHRAGWWDQHVPDLAVTFVRGFPEDVTASLAEFLAWADTIRRLTPVFRWHLPSLGSAYVVEVPDAEWVRPLTASPLLAWVNELDLKGSPVRDAGLKVLLKSPHAGLLSVLRLNKCGISTDGASWLAAAPRLGHLTTLDLGRNYLGPAGVQALLQSPHLDRLTDLDLGGDSTFVERYNMTYSPVPNIGEEGVIVLAQSPRAARLRRLNLSNNDLENAAAQALIDSPYLGQLAYLRVGNYSYWTDYDDHQYRINDVLLAGLQARFGPKAIHCG